MKMKKLLMIFVLCICFFLTGCGAFFGEEESLMIQSIETEVLEDGNTKIIITYANEDVKPVEFIIPKGEKGEDGIIGNGIKDITYVTSSDGKSTVLTVNYTDPEVESSTFEIPNGVSVTGVEYKLDPATRNTLMYVKYSNGETSAPITILKGTDGNGFSGYDVEQQLDGSQIIKFHFTQSEDVVITIPAPQKGNGISSIISSETDTEYKLTINYENGEKEEVAFNKPEKPNQWFNGGMRPTQTIGKDGDYYFDTQHKEIYVKENGDWTLIVDFNVSEQVFTVKFDLNDSTEEPAYMPTGSFASYVLKRESIFSDNGYGEIPIPIRPGYNFVGWYRTKNITPINAPFTDLTPINSNLVLYAIWEKAE